MWRRKKQPQQGTPLLTVGITSYNEADVIGRCLRSIAEQTLESALIEVIVVDDVSTDGTSQSAMHTAEEAGLSNFRLIRQKRAGTPSRGRNTILDQARGEYVFFLDADDYLGPRALDAMLSSAQKHRSDIVVGKYVGVNRFAPNVTGAAELPLVHGYHSGWLNSLHVQKLFRADFLLGLTYRFNEALIYCSDHPFMISAFLHAKKVSFVNNVDCYFIVLGKESVPARSVGLKSAAAEILRTGHVSRADISAKDQMRFVHDCFGILALGRGQGGDTARRAGQMRAHYWSRLMRVHLPALIQRKDTEEQVSELASEALFMAELYGAETSRVPLGQKGASFLDALRSQDPQVVASTAADLRASVGIAPTSS